MLHKFEGWAKAPEGTTHFCTQDCGSPWLKVDAIGFLWYHNDRRWQPYYTKAAGHRHMMNAIARPKKRAKVKAVVAYKPLAVGEKLTIENFRTTQAYQQVKRFVDRNKATPYQQGQLVRLFLGEYNNCQKGEEAAHWCDNFNEDGKVVHAFDWEKSRHGFNFWSAVHNGRQVDNLAAVLAGNPAKQEEVKVVAARPRVDGVVEVVIDRELPPAPAEVVEKEEPKPKVGKVGWW